MNVYKKSRVLLIPATMEKVWHFFSRPENLDKITPKDMAFEIVTDIKNVEMYEGMLIEYNVSPLFNIKMNWITEITHIKKHQYFVDEQRFGPYALWHHEHHFEATANGILMMDLLYYAIPYGVLGRIANKLLIEKRIEEIFAYREQAVKKVF